VRWRQQVDRLILLVQHDREAGMLADVDAIATVGVRDLRAARKFYESVLGLKVLHIEGEGAIEFEAGNAKLLVYVSEFAGTNKATAVTWTVGGGVEEIVRDLKAKGVTFEHYDLPDTRLSGDIHHAGRLRLAWFKDPDGNILALVGDS
jgi:catechol 2,3-dioxygenase-like lactoylglutathione lyase family enzyme